jgi:prepilin-type N-terminal cleavage/methylation domain-containing protein
MNRRSSGRVRSNGFTLLELILVLAIIAVLFMMLAGALIDVSCSAKVKVIKDAITHCQNVIDTQGDADAVVSCLNEAQKAIDQAKSCLTGSALQGIEALIEIVNRKVETYADNGGFTPQQRDKMKGAKLHPPI